jgi:hypothetical protein
MTFPAMVLPGQRLTADRLNAGFAIGRLVFKAYRDTAQSISNSTVGTTANALSWDSVELNTLGGWSASLPTRFTPPIAGWYALTGEAAFAGDSAPGSRRGATWLVNGAVAAAGTSVGFEGTITADESMTSGARALPVELDGTEYVELAPFQDSGAALNTATGSLRPHIAVYYVGPS